jgi:ribosomal protein S18 acetylase RimI-like enzyme
MSPIRIEAATPADASTIAALCLSVWIDTYATDGLSPDFAHYLFEEFSAPRIAAQCAAPGSKAFVARSNGLIVGICNLDAATNCPARSDAPQQEITRLYVLRRFARQGIGSRLLRHALADMERHGLKTAWLTVWAHNADARAFYASQGFIDAGFTTFRLAGRNHENRVLVRAV